MQIDVSIRRMLPEDIKQAMRLKEAENWNQTEEDWKFFLTLQPDLCWVATHEERVVGTVTAIRHNNHLSWIGMMLVSEEYRGQGLGSRLIERILEKLTLSSAVKLDATAEGRFVYTKFGFKDELTIYRMVRPPNQLTVSDPEESSAEIVTKKEFEEVVACDREIYGANRADLLRYLYDNSRRAWLIRRVNTVTGYAFSRTGSNYHQIGPVGASTTTDAKILLSRTLKNFAHLPLVADVLERQSELVKWLKGNGFEIQRQFVRMYYQENPTPGNTENQFLIAGPEFG